MFNIGKAEPFEKVALEEALTGENIVRAPELPRAVMTRLDFVARDQKHEMRGGIQAKRVNWGILHIELLFVYERYRNQGIASALLEHVEKIAKEHKCHVAHLSTFDFQAKDFYLQHGYSIFGALENTPRGHSRFYMKKDLCKTNHAPLVRLMRASDIELLIADFTFPWSSIQATRELWQTYYAEHQQNIRTVAILEKENRIVGYGNLLRRSKYPHFSDIPEINNVWIDEEHRRSGFGKALIIYLETMAKKEGYKQIGIGVGLYKDYGPAQKLYFQLGYQPDGNGMTHKCHPVVPGEKYPVDDDLILWLVKPL